MRTTISLVDGAPAALAAPSPRRSPAPAGKLSAGPAARAGSRRTRSSSAPDQVTYDSDADVVTATGAVRMERDGNYLAADQVVWNRKTGEVRADGNVVVINPQGDKLIGDNVVLTDTLARRHGRQSAGRAGKRRPHRRGAGRRAAATSRSLDNAIYSPCPVTTPDRLPAQPELGDHRRAGHPRSRGRASPLPGRAAADLRRRPCRCCRSSAWRPAATAAGSAAVLVPDISISTAQRARDRASLLLAARPATAISRSRRMSTPACCRRSKADIASSTGSARSRSAASSPTARSSDSTELGATDEPSARASAAISRPTARPSSTRCGASPARSASPPTRPSPAATTSRSDDRLRKLRQCRADQPQQLYLDRRLGVPGPARRRCAEADPDRPCRRSMPASGSTTPVIGGKVELQANSLAILRIEGQDTQRAFASARWDLRRLTNWGQELRLHRLRPRRRLSHRGFGEHRRRHLSRHGRLALRAASERSRPT